MSLPQTIGYAPNATDDSAGPIFDVQKISFQFEIAADFVAAQAANNVLILALSTSRILRFDLDSPKDVDDIDLPKRPAEIGIIRKLFLDPSASHLIISTTLGENYYLHTQSRQPKALPKFKSVQIESIAWNPALPTASTREILIGTADGNIYETSIEPSTEFYRSQEKYVRNVYNPHDGAVTGIYVDQLSAHKDIRRIFVASKTKISHFAGKIGKSGNDGGGGGIYSKLFESETPTIHDSERGAATSPSSLAISPSAIDTPPSPADARTDERAYAWLNAQGVYHGPLLTSSPDSASLGRMVFRDSKLLPPSRFLPPQQPGARSKSHQISAISSTILTQFHIVALIEGRLAVVNRLDESLVYNERILEPGQTALGLFADHQKSTYWLFTAQDIFEIVVTDETRYVWQIMLKQGNYEGAQQYARTAEQKDAVASMTGDHLMSLGRFDEAATLLGKSTKAFEDVALAFIDKGEQDALRKYLLTKLSGLKRSLKMQRSMLASWLVELYMAKLNQLDDTISTKAEPSPYSSARSAQQVQKQLPAARTEFQEFCARYKSDLDAKTVYETISAHGREDELLFYANLIEDYNYVLGYWVQREKWDEAMNVLKKQTDPQMFYRYATVLMSQLAISASLVEILMRQPDLDVKKIIPALLNYNKLHGSTGPLSQNQAIRYLRFCIDHSHSEDPAVHNTLISLYASNPSKDESALLDYLKSQSIGDEHFYDADFALRLCIAHQRVQSCVHIYTAMRQYAAAVDLALKHDQIELAASVADTPDIGDAQRKKLWLKIAKKVIGREKGIKSAIEFLKQCDLLHIEDLIPFFPDFIIIDDFKEEICAELERYSQRIDALKREMDDAASTAQHIQSDIKALDERYAIVEPGERCWKCRLPLLMRQFFVFPCQHAFHADCLGEMVMHIAGFSRGKRIRELQKEIGRGVALGKRREGMVKELDGLVAGACVLCSEMAVKLVDEPFITKEDDLTEWAV